MHRILPLALFVCLDPHTALAGDQPSEPVRFGRAVKTSEVPSLHRSSIAFSPDGKKLAWMHYVPDTPDPKDGGLVIHLWDTEKRQPLAEMKAALDRTYAYSPVRFTPNGRMLLAGDFRVLSLFEGLGKPEEKLRNNVAVWLVLSGRELLTLQGDIGTRELAVEAVAVSPDGRAVIGVHSKGGIVWMIPEAKEERRFEFGPATRLV